MGGSDIFSCINLLAFGSEVYLLITYEGKPYNPQFVAVPDNGNCLDFNSRVQ
jgi:hypothetical protein